MSSLDLAHSTKKHEVFGKLFSGCNFSLSLLIPKKEI
jgi:hypothetical protein